MAIEAVGIRLIDVPPTVVGRSLKIDNYVRDLTPIFSDPRVYTFLETLGQTVVRRKQETKIGGHISLGSAVEDTGKVLGLSEADLAQMKGKYDQTVLLFLPEAQKLARIKAKRVGGDFDEWQSIASEVLTRVVARFNWRTFDKDASDAVKKFLSTIEKILHDPLQYAFDTESLEVSSPVYEFVGTSTVEQQALENETNKGIMELIDRYIASKTDNSKRNREILRLVVLEGLSTRAVVETTGMSQTGVYKILNRFKRSLPEFLKTRPRGKIIDEEKRKKMSLAIDDYLSRNSLDTRKRILRLKMLEGRNVPEISRMIGVKESTVEYTIHDFRDGLPEPLKSKNAVKGWAAIFRDGPEKYRRLYVAKKHMLPPFFQEMVELFFELNTGERDSTITAVHEALKARGRQISRDSVRRHVLKGLHLLDNKERLPHLGRNGPLEKHREREIISKIHKDPVFLQSLTPQQQKVVELYWEAMSQRKTPFQKDIAEAIRVHNCTVSRDLDRIARKYIRSLDLPR